jgi:mono/diheme cytochrome c family protein
MKIKFIIPVVAGILIASCSPKVSQPVAEKPAVDTAHEKAVAEGKSMYENNCARCHKLFTPTDRTEEQWAPILVRMQKKAKLDDQQMAMISTYINSEAN